jgi:hypothetical protein
VGNVRAPRIRATPPRGIQRAQPRPASSRGNAVSASQARSRGPSADDAAPQDVILELQQTAGNQAVVQLLVDGDRPTPPPVPSAHLALGNRALTALLAGTLQRAPAATPASGTSKPAPAKVAKGKDSTREFNSYAGVVNAFHHMTMAAINDNGVGLGLVKFDRDLFPEHRRLLDQVRSVLVGQTKKESGARRAAAAAWPGLAARMLKAVDQARPLGLMPTMLAAVTDDVALIGRVYLKAKPAANEPEEVTYKGLNDAVDAVNDLVWAFHKGGEAGPGIVQEQVPSRKDIVIPKSVLDGNLQARTELAQVQLGSHLTARHRKVLERLRAALTAARSETAGSAWVGLQQFRAIRGEIDYILGGANLQQAVEHTELRSRFNEIEGKLAAHYAAVHQENLARALTKERPAGQDEIDKSFGAMHPKLAARIKESRVIDDFKYALGVIENHLTQSPVRTNEWILTSGGTVIRIRPDQAAGLREAAKTQVKAYMASIVTEMVEAWDTYDQIQRGTGSTRRHILGALGGADDPGDQSDAKNNVIEVRNSKVYPLADQGKFVEALEEILRQKADVDRRAVAVGEYDADLDKGYGRLAKAAAVVQVALVSLVPIAGEAAMATTLVEGAVVEGASGLAVTATGTAAGAGGAFLGETGRQLAFDDKMDWGKAGSTAWTGGTIGFGAGGGAMTKGLSNLVAPAAEGTELVGANMFASSVVGAGQDVLGGGNGVTGMATGGLGSMAGHLADTVAPMAKAPMTNIALQGVAGAGVSYATDQDMLTGAVGNMTGAVGNRMRMPKGGAGPEAPAGPREQPGPTMDTAPIGGVTPALERPGAATPTPSATTAVPAGPSKATATKDLGPHPAPVSEGPVTGVTKGGGGSAHTMDPTVTDGTGPAAGKPGAGSVGAKKPAVVSDVAPATLEPVRGGTAGATLDYPAGSVQLNAGRGHGPTQPARPAPSASDLQPRLRSEALQKKAIDRLGKAGRDMAIARDLPPESPMRVLAESQLREAQDLFQLAFGQRAPTADEYHRLNADEALANAEAEYADVRGAAGSPRRAAADQKVTLAQDEFNRARDALATAHANARSAQEHGTQDSPLMATATADFERADAAFRKAKTDLAQAKAEQQRSKAGLAPTDWRRRRAEIALHGAQRDRAKEYGLEAPPEAVGPMRKGQAEELHGPAQEERFAPELWDQEMVIQLSDPRSKSAAEELVLRMLIQDPTREIGLFRNSVTGEYIVVRGKAQAVTVESEPGADPKRGGSGPASGGKAQRWKELLGKGQDIGDWELELHTHPGTKDQAVDPLAQYPSGGKGDFGVIYKDSQLAGDFPKRSRIWYFDGTMPKMTEFGFDPHDPEPYWIKLPGKPVERFASIPEYEDHVRQQMATFGIVPKFEPAPHMPIGMGRDQGP